MFEKFLLRGIMQSTMDPVVENGIVIKTGYTYIETFFY